MVATNVALEQSLSAAFSATYIYEGGYEREDNDDSCKGHVAMVLLTLSLLLLFAWAAIAECHARAEFTGGGGKCRL